MEVEIKARPVNPQQSDSETALSASRKVVLEEVAKQIHGELEAAGWFVMRELTISTHEFRFIGEQLGTILSDGKIQVLAKPVSLATSEKQLPLHNDEPLARYLAWYCEKQQSGRGVPTDLLDISDFENVLGRETIKTLTTIVIPGSNRGQKDEWAMLMVKGEPRPNFVPWAQHVLDTPEKAVAWNRFCEYVRSKAHDPEAIKSVTLAEGEMLFLNNNKFLHGRMSLASGSERCLRRLWIGD